VVRLRRITITLVIAVALATLAASLSPPPREEPPRNAAPANDRGGRQGRSPDQSGQVVRFTFDASTIRAPKITKLRTGAHVVVTVRVPAPGEVAIERLGLVDAATPAAPATFDLLLERPGRFEALYRPVTGRPRLVGAMVVQGA
jgi:hypothetical protein